MGLFEIDSPNASYIRVKITNLKPHTSVAMAWLLGVIQPCITVYPVQLAIGLYLLHHRCDT